MQGPTGAPGTDGLKVIVTYLHVLSSVCVHELQTCGWSPLKLTDGLDMDSFVLSPPQGDRGVPGPRGPPVSLYIRHIYSHL